MVHLSLLTQHLIAHRAAIAQIHATITMMAVSRMGGLHSLYWEKMSEQNGRGIITEVSLDQDFFLDLASGNPL